ncbi:kynureninase [Sphingomonas sp. ASV193]|uniref:kynureninase n=1 Tax=Sphingomonas sp. ASV193 TaxID=3144405 RepID=UPI0032E87CD9
MARALDAADPLGFARGRFAVPDGVYLDGNSLGMRPRAAAARVAATVEREWGEDLITSWTKHGWIDWPTALAEPLARLVGASADELAWADSTSINLTKLAVAALQSSGGRASGRRVIVTEARNFPTDLYVAQGISTLVPGVEVRHVAREALAEAMSDEVALLMLTHVDYRSGERHDVAALSAAARTVGALSLWDLSHSAGALDCRLEEWGADLAVGCGYKYLNGGPGAPAWLYVRRAHQPRLDNPLPGWMGHAAPFAFDGTYRPADGMRRWLTGTPPVIALAAVAAGLATFEGVEPGALEAKAGALTELFIAEVAARCPVLALAAPREASARGAQVSFAHPDAYAIVQALIARGVVGDFRAPDLMRFGFAPLATRFEDAVIAAEALAGVLSSGAWRDPAYAARKAVT